MTVQQGKEVGRTESYIIIILPHGPVIAKEGEIASYQKGCWKLHEERDGFMCYWTPKLPLP